MLVFTFFCASGILYNLPFQCRVQIKSKRELRRWYPLGCFWASENWEDALLFEIILYIFLPLGIIFWESITTTSVLVIFPSPHAVTLTLSVLTKYGSGKLYFSGQASNHWSSKLIIIEANRRKAQEQRRLQMQTSVIIETDHESSVPSSKTMSLLYVSNGSEIQYLYPLLLRFGAMSINQFFIVVHYHLAEDWVLLSTIKALQNDGVAILINLFGGRTYETPCFSPSLLLLTWW